MDCFLNESQIPFADLDLWKGTQTDYQDNISHYFSDSYFSFRHQQEPFSPQPMLENLQLQKLSEPPEFSTPQKPKKVGRSFHHNSQKHTVITIRQLVSLKRNEDDSEERELMMKMWRIFQEGKKKTKEVLQVLFGAADLGNERDLKLFEMYGFKSILQYPKHEIRKAQDLLRQATIEQITPAKITLHLATRRVSEKENFRIYLEGFLEQIVGSPLKNRLTKCNSYGSTKQ